MKPETQRIIMIIGTTIGVLGGLAGMVVAIIASPIFGSIFSLFFIVVFGWVFGGLYLRGRKRKQLLQSGVQANAQIVEIWDTGVTVNNQPQIGMKLRVTPQTGMPYDVETKMVISRLQTAYYQPGVSCVVRYDPNDQSSVAIESIGGSVGDSSQQSSQQWGTEASGCGMAPAGTFFAGKSPKDVEAWLTKNDTEGKRIMQTGIECKAIVLKNEWMGAYVNGQNPATAFELEVLPDNEPAYNAKCYGVIMQSSVPKYQPGKQIWIKYDPDDKNRITISHS
jgi:uncharacterized protein DUF3592